jgi:ABC-type cobalt transport system substrate-binding protein
MKKVFLSIAAMLVLGASAFAAGGDDNVNQQAVSSFKKDFTNASNAVWEPRDGGLSKATFSFNGQVLFAYYDSNGNLQAVVRNIVSDQLPINLVASLRKEYGDCWISDLFELAANGQTTYYVTVENGDKKVVLKSSGSEYWETYSKEKK